LRVADASLGFEVITKIRKLLTVAAATTALVAAAATPASAAYDDSFSAHSAYDSTCENYGGYSGWVYFIDYGEGDLSNPAKNDDYIDIRDTCAADHDGVIAEAWLNGI